MPKFLCISFFQYSLFIKINNKLGFFKIIILFLTIIKIYLNFLYINTVHEFVLNFHYKL